MVENSLDLSDENTATQEPVFNFTRKMPPKIVNLDSRQDDNSVTPDLPPIDSTKCTDCGKAGNFAINRKEGTIVCTACGLVQKSSIIDETSEWRNFGNDNGDGQSNANRVGGKLNPYLTDFGLSTMV